MGPGGIGFRPNSGDPAMIVDALLTLAESPVSATGTRTVLETLLRPANVNDRWIRDAGIAAAARDDIAFLENLLNRGLPANVPEDYSANVADVVMRVARHYAADDTTADIPTIVGFIGGAAQFDPALAPAAVAGVAQGWPDFAAPALTDAQAAVVRNARSTLAEPFHESLDLLAEKWEIDGMPE